MPRPKVSVLMSVYNGERYLREAVQSILNQTFTDFEFIIVDDGSTDETPIILDSYTDPRIVRLHNSDNLGLARSLNRGLTVAGGSYVARMDADDRSLPQRLNEQVRFMDSHPDIGLLGCCYQIIAEDGRVIGTPHPPLTNAEIQRYLLENNCFSHGSVMMRRACLRQVGLYDASLSTTQDWDMWLRIAERWQVANLAEPLYQWRKSPTAISVRWQGQQVRNSWRVLQSTFHRRVGALEEGPGSQLTEWELFRLGCIAYALGDNRRGQQFVSQALSQSPGVVTAADDISTSLLSYNHYSGRSTLKEKISYTEAVLSNFPPGRQRKKIQRLALAKLYAHQGFLAHEQRQLDLARRYFWQAIAHDVSWLGNRGVIAIFVKSLIGSPSFASGG